MVKIPAEIKRLYKLGFAVHWLRPRSKVPVEKGWTKSGREKWSTLREKYRQGYNPGGKLGFASKLLASGDYLAVIDVDVKSENPKHRKEALTALFKLFPEVKGGPHLLSGRGNGSAHYYVRVAEPTAKDELKARSTEKVRVKMPSVPPNTKERELLSPGELAAGIRLRPAWEISLLCNGRQVVLVGAIHPDTGEAYKWGEAISEDGGNIPRITPKVSAVVTEAVKNLDHETGLVKPKTGNFQFVPVDPHKLGLRRDQVAAITEGTGVTDRSAEVFGLCMALVQRKVSDEKIISLFTDREFYLGNCAYDHAKTTDRQRAANWIARYCLMKAKERVNNEANVFDIEEIDEAGSLQNVSNGETKAQFVNLPKGVTDPTGWQKDLEVKFTRGRPPVVKATYINIRLILANECLKPGFLRHDLFSLNDFYVCDTPWGCTKGKQRSAGTEDALKVKIWLSEKYGIEPPLNMIDEALNSVALENAFHPLRDYLNSLKWDGVERIEKAFKTYLGAKMPEPYLSDVSRKFFLACVKRAFEPGCKFDHVVVLEGSQGIGKSTFAETIAQRKWFLDGLPNFSDKDAAVNLRGIWICELSELAALYKSANEATKSFISRHTDKFRPPYGQRRMDFPRTTVFLGTTNAHDYLTDASGNRRFWPVYVQKCDFRALERDRDQLWAEALFLYQFCNEPLYLKGRAKSQAAEIQELRRIEDETDLMAEKFLDWISQSRADGNDLRSITVSELFNGPWLAFPQNMGNLKRAGDVLRRAGYRKKHSKKGKFWTC